jgi:protocatechuate 4,5-dioxygenase alpha subunit
MVEFVLAVLLLELTPGPNMAYLGALAVARGRATGLYATLGVALGLSVHALVTAFGAGALIQHYPWLYEILRWTGVTYLLYLSWEGWQTQPDHGPERLSLLSNAGPLLLRGFLSNVFNPKSILFFVSVVPSFVRSGPGDATLSLQMTSLGIVYVGVATAVHASIVILAGELGPWLVQGPRQRMVRRSLSIALALVAFWLMWTNKTIEPRRIGGAECWLLGRKFDIAQSSRRPSSRQSLSSSPLQRAAMRHHSIPGTTLFDGSLAAKGLPLNRMCFSFNNAENRAAFLRDEDGYCRKYGLTDEQREAVRERNVLKLIAAGGNIYYLAKLAGIFGLSVQDIGAQQTRMSVDQFKAKLAAAGR